MNLWNQILYMGNCRIYGSLQWKSTSQRIHRLFFKALNYVGEILHVRNTTIITIVVKSCRIFVFPFVLNAKKLQWTRNIWLCMLLVERRRQNFWSIVYLAWSELLREIIEMLYNNLKIYKKIRLITNFGNLIPKLPEI